MDTLVGVLSPARMFRQDNPRRDEYRFGNNYGNRIYDLGGIPLGILPSDGRVSEKVLDKFDSFLICGGSKFWPHHLQVVHHAYTTGKPLLGICLGMQSIYYYFHVREYMELHGRRNDDLFAVFQEIRAMEGKLPDVTGHDLEHIRGREDETKQLVRLLPGSHVHRLMGTDTIRAGSFHVHCIPPDPPAPIAVTGWAEDGTVDVIECGEKILGVQFHPEIDRELLPLFSILV